MDAPHSPSQDNPPEGVRYVGPESPPAGPPRPALFLDRDGIVVEEVGYLHEIENLNIQQGAPALIRAANQAGVAAVVITNQSGIDRGLYTWDDYAAIDREIERRLAVEGARLDARVACGYHPRFTKNWGELHEFWRKPGPGMFLLAVNRMGLSAGRSWMIGDMASDAEAARSAGLAGSIHMHSVHGLDHGERAQALVGAGFVVHLVEALAEGQAVLAAAGLFTKP